MKTVVLTFLILGLAFASSGKISTGLVKTFKSQDLANVVVNFVGDNSQVIEIHQQKSFQTRSQRINSLVSLLQGHAKELQQRVRSFLESQHAEYNSYWISNQIYAFGVNLTLVKLVTEFPEVLSVEQEPIFQIQSGFKNVDVNTTADLLDTPGWNLRNIQVPEAWEITDGTGIVVAHIDTGVRYTHVALRNNFRSYYGWFDAYDRSSLPNDGNSHGTHTMGTLAGSRDSGVGVATGARWIACKGCDANAACRGDTLTACGQWMLCPTLPDGSNADCSMAPNLVSNSWNNAIGNEQYYAPVVNAWVAAKIIPIFAVGNSGPSCGTILSPGDFKTVIGVGATNDQNEIADFASIGPTVDGQFKPDVSAPGDQVRSSVAQSDNTYEYWYGTSMATPHVAGVVALVLSIRPDLGLEEVRSLIRAGVDTNVTGQNRACGGVRDNTFPNYHFGYGKINALKVLKATGAI